MAGGVQRAPAQRYFNFLLDLERELKMERNLILQQEEMLWLQKSRIEWLKLGDNNTRLFHTSTMVRRRRNKIHMLKESKGRWVEGREELKTMAIYTNLFKSDKCSPLTFITGQFPVKEAQQQGVWKAEFSMEEIRKALKETGSWKASGPDMYQPGFFQRTWDTTEVCIYKL